MSSPSAAGDRRRFLLALAALGLFLALLAAGGDRSEELTAPADRLSARLTAGLAVVAGIPVARDGTVLRHPGGFSCQITTWCSDWLVLLSMAVGLFALPGRVAAKFRFAVAGGAALVALNQVRLLHLLWTGIRSPAAFDLLHRAVWEPLMVVSVLALWALWLRTHRRKEIAQ